MMIRASTKRDHQAVWQILEPMIRAGDTYPLSSDMNRTEALGYWFAQDHEVFVAEKDDLSNARSQP